jgi:hypothetical protein
LSMWKLCNSSAPAWPPDVRFVDVEAVQLFRPGFAAGCEARLCLAGAV